MRKDSIQTRRNVGNKSIVSKTAKNIPIGGMGGHNHLIFGIPFNFSFLGGVFMIRPKLEYFKAKVYIFPAFVIHKIRSNQLQVKVWWPLKIF